MKLINLTPHAIDVYDREKKKKIITIPPKPITARVETEEKEGGCIIVDANEANEASEAILVPVAWRKLLKITGIPDIESENTVDTIYIVSSMVLEAMKLRKDPRLGHCVSPDTGSTAVRDEKGNIIGVTRFIVGLPV